MCARWDSTVRTREVELLADLGVGVPECDQAQDLDLALGEVVGRARGFGGAAASARAQARVEIRVAGGGAAHRFDQLLVGGLLEDVAERRRAAARGERTPGPPAW